MKRATIHVALALCIAAGITGGLVFGVPGVIDSPIDSNNNISEPDDVPGGENGTTVNESLNATASEYPQYEDVAQETGFEYEPVSQLEAELIAASGVYIVDFNNDGYEDILAVGGENPVLFKNTGDGYEQHRVFDHDTARSAHFLDYNNNGNRDLIIAEYGDSPTFYANVDGSFEQRDVGFDENLANPVSITSADFNGNGCLDVFIAQYGLYQSNSPMTLEQLERLAEDHPEYRVALDTGFENKLYRGDCESFADVSNDVGVTGEKWTLSSSATDFTGDGHADIHIANDFESDYMYVNNGDGTFEKKRFGPETDRNAMSSAVEDMTGNHEPDIFVTNVYASDDMSSTREGREIEMTDAPNPHGNNLLVNDGTGNFTDIAADHGVEKGGWGWAVTLRDLNNDGYLDITHTVTPHPPFEPYPGIYQTMQVWTGEPGTWEKHDGNDYGFNPDDNTRGIASVDYNNDGDLDLVVATSRERHRGKTAPAEPYRLYENQMESGESLQFFVRNPDGLERNAEVYIETDKRTMYRVVNSQGDFLSQDSRMVHVGLANEDIERVTIVWPDGKRTEYTALERGNRYILTPNEVDQVT